MVKYPYEFDSKKRRISNSYRRGKLMFYLASLLVSLSTSLFILFNGIHLVLRNFAMQYPLSTLVYGFLILLIFTITGFPLALYSTFVYDRRFKLARYNISGWLKEYLKTNLIYYVFSLIIISLLYFSIRTFSLWWVYAGIFSIAFSTFVNYIYPSIIVPFMWKTEPYKDKGMKERILSLCRRLGVKNIKNVFVVKESEKTSRSNAFFYGIGNQQKIALFDNLLHDFTREEVETIVGHELGHYVNKDIIRGIIFDAILIFPVLFLVNYIVGLYVPAFGINGIFDIASLPLIGLVYSALEFLVMPLSNSYSRYVESEADAFALEHVRKPVAQLSSEKRLADMNLAELKPNPLIEFWLFTHPATFRRIKMAQGWKPKK